MTKSLKLAQMLVRQAAMLALGGVVALGVAAKKPEHNPNRPPQRQQAPLPPARNNAVAPRTNATSGSGNRTNSMQPQNLNHRNYSGNGNRPPAAAMGPGRTNNLSNGHNENTS